MTVKSLKISLKQSHAIYGPEPVVIEERTDGQKRKRLVVVRRGEAAFTNALDQTQRDAYDDLTKGHHYAQSGIPTPRMRFNDTPGKGVHSGENPHIVALVNHYNKWRAYIVTNAPYDVQRAIMGKLAGDTPEQIARTLNAGSTRPNQRRAIRLICLGLDAYAFTRGWSRTSPKF